MKNNIENKISNTLFQLAQCFPQEYPLYIVGGFVRDCILGNNASLTDVDLACALNPQELKELLIGSEFSVIPNSEKLGTMLIRNSKTKEGFEYTAFRTDSYPLDSGKHSPDEVLFTKDIILDAKRRDFKCNAVYFDIKNREIIDPLNGIKDIENKILDCVIEPEETLSQDGLRILRLIRFQSTLGFEISQNTFYAAMKMINRLQDIKVERIQIELKKILNGEHCFEALQNMQKIGALKIIIPELDKNKNVPQNSSFHKYDVLTHTFHCVKNCPKEVRLAALFHDIDKATCLYSDGNMHMHPYVGEKTTVEVMTRLKFSKEEIRKTSILVKTHMYNGDGQAKRNKLRKFIVTYNKYLDDILKLKKADIQATGYERRYEIELDPLYVEREQMKKENIPFELKDLAINGSDLKKLGYSGRQIGEKLKEIFDKCLYGILKNSKEDILNFINGGKRRSKNG